MKIKVFGKLNLTLSVCGTRNGLHKLSSIMSSVSVCDELIIKQSNKPSVRFTNSTVSETDNTAYKTAVLLSEKFGLNLDITITKGIPIGGGMGGSSADSAGVFACARLMLGSRLNDSILSLAKSIGSDVPFMLDGGYALIEGVGDKITKIPSHSSYTALIVECGNVSTAECYKKFDEVCKFSRFESSDLLKKLENNIQPLSHDCFNNLLIPASLLNPRINQALDICKTLGESGHLTGSGGCIFILTTSEKVREKFFCCGYNAFFVHSKLRGFETETDC